MTTTEPKRLGGRYEIGDLLGRGGMAEVHRAEDVRLGRTVAVKTLRTDLARDSSFQARFRREAQSAASLNHPAIVAVYDTGEDDVGDLPVPYIVMEYVDGSTLRELLQSDRRLLPERALEITDGVLQALDYSHRQGIVHRDIKPANVMLTRAGQVKVMDFGIARAVADTAATMTATAAVIGTAQYLSPEQARGERVDARSDIYSTGCLLYELLTGRPPFVGESPVSVAYQHVREDPVPPSQLDPEVSPAVDAVVLKALAKNPDNRYQSAAEMRVDVERVLNGQPVLATPVLAETTQRMAGVTETAYAPGLEDEEAPSRGRRSLMWALLILAILTVFGIAALVGNALLGGSGTQQVAVPDLTGLTVEEAQAALEQEGLTLGQQTPGQSDSIPEGRISEQDPPANQQVDENTAVNVTVVAGATQVTVPEVVGQSRAEAEEAIRGAGLTVGDVTEENSAQTPAGQVLRQDPAGGEQLAEGSAVTLVVASGSAEVPDVVGRSEAEAVTTLQGAGFDVRVNRVPDATVPSGQVITQSPAGGESARTGTQVSIAVSTGAPQPTQTPTQTQTQTPEPTQTQEQTPSPTGPGGDGD